MMMTGNRKERSALEIVQRLRDHGYTALYAGGYVRDMVMDLPEKGDIDIATSAKPKEVMDLFPHVIPVGEQFGVVIVVKDELPFEVATFRKDIGILDGRHPQTVDFADAREDAMRRDFTINGMFFDPLTSTVYDYVNGREDLKKGIVRAIGEPSRRFEEDFLRMIRAVRFGARFGFSIEEKTWLAIREKAGAVSRISSERIFAELDKILCGPHPDAAIRLLHESGLLGVILPEVEAMAGVSQPREFHPEGDVFTHTLAALSLLDHPDRLVAWSALLHDIGKPRTMTVEDRIRFSSHDRVGATMAGALLRRLKASSSLIEGVYEVIDNHMNFMNVKKMRLSTLKKFLSRPLLDGELELHRVDCLASHGDVSNYDFVKEKRSELSLQEIKPSPLLTGKDLIGLGLSPGPLFGTILAEAYDMQLEEKLATHEEAVAWARKKYAAGV